MHKSLLLIVTAIFITLSVMSCDPQRKLRKSTNVEDKDSAAMQYYRRGKYEEALYLLDELRGVYRGKQRAEEIWWYYSMTHYQLGHYVSAAFFFGEYTKIFPNSNRREEAEFMEAYCYYLLSDPWYLDQKYTYKAIENLQLFAIKHPQAPQTSKAKDLVKELQGRLATKAFEQAMLYLKLEKYQAAVVTFDVFLKEYPDSDYREEAWFNKVKASVRLAEKSTTSKQRYRYEQALKNYQKFVDIYPSTKFAKDADSLYEEIRKALEKLREDKNAVKTDQEAMKNE